MTDGLKEKENKEGVSNKTFSQNIGTSLTKPNQKMVQQSLSYIRNVLCSFCGPRQK